MTSRLIGLLIIISFSGSCSTTTNDLVNISSVDTVKKYISGVWYQTNGSTTNTYEYQFIKDLRGLRIEGTKNNNETTLIQTDPTTFELLNQNNAVRIKFTSLTDQTIKDIKFLSKNKLIIDDGEYYKK